MLALRKSKESSSHFSSSRCSNLCCSCSKGSCQPHMEDPNGWLQVWRGPRCCKIRLNSERHPAEFAPHQRRVEAAADVGGLARSNVQAPTRWEARERVGDVWREGQEASVGACRGGPDHRVQGACQPAPPMSNEDEMDARSSSRHPRSHQSAVSWFRGHRMVVASNAVR